MKQSEKIALLEQNLLELSKENLELKKEVKELKSMLTPKQPYRKPTKYTTAKDDFGNLLLKKVQI